MGKYVGAYFVMATFALFIVSVALDIANLYMTRWKVVASAGLYRGLWQECAEYGNHSDCTLIARSPAENIAIACISLGALFKIPALLLTVIKRWRFHRCRIPLTISTCVAGLLSLMAVGVYAAFNPDLHQDEPSTFGFSFELTVGNMVLTFALAIACWHVFLTKEVLDSAPRKIDTNRTERSHEVRMIF